MAISGPRLYCFATFRVKNKQQLRYYQTKGSSSKRKIQTLITKKAKKANPELGQ